MKPTVKTLGEVLYAPSQYVIPVFQRNYRWDTPQWQKLLDSLGEINQPNKRGNHFMGFLVFVPGLAQPGQHTTFHLIDGQQRLTTLSILLTAIRNVARDLKQGEFADQHLKLHPGSLWPAAAERGFDRKIGLCNVLDRGRQFFEIGSPCCR